MSNKLKGKYGEELACKYLIDRGYEIIARNFRYSRYGEIDIIAYKDKVISFVEVKYRTSEFFGTPLEAITKDKLHKIYMCARYFLSITDKKYKSFSIDALSVLSNNDIPEIKHIKNIQF